MAIDYSPRRTVPKNRPKKQPVSLLIPIVTVAVVVSFAAGMLTGWLCLPPRRTLSSTALLYPDQGTPAPTPAGNSPANAPVGQEPPLTFYQTLSKENSNALIGSGLNPRRPGDAAPVPTEHQPQVSQPSTAPAAPPAVKPASPHVATPTPHAATPVTPSAVKPSTPAAVKQPTTAAVKSATTASTAPAAPPASNAGAGKEEKKGALKGGGYTVQVASYRDRKEAEAVVARSIEKGLAAYILVLKSPDNGVWYRVRIGKRLDQQAAANLAARAGKGAVVVAE